MTIENLFQELSTLGNPISFHPKRLFRGQAMDKWTLEPSLTRILNERKLTRSQAIQAEREAINQFYITAKTIFPIERTITLLPSEKGLDFLGWFTEMQHYSAPTRYLDWSKSPWVALYFACFDYDFEDGAVWVVNYEKADMKANEALKKKDIKELISNPESDNVVCFTMATNANERMEAQQGRFSLATNPLMDHLDFYKGSDILEKITIPHSLKYESILRLNAMNINAKTLFPGADGLGRSMREFYKHWDKSSKIN